MHSRTESGIALDWHDVLRIEAEKRREAARLRNLAHVNCVLQQLGRQATPEELAEAQALLDRAPEAQAELKLGKGNSRGNSNNG